MSNYNEISSFIWSICDDVLRGLFKPYEYGDVILPFLVLRRLDCVLEGKKDSIIQIHERYEDVFADVSSIIYEKLKIKFYNYSRYDLKRLKDDPDNIGDNFDCYRCSFSPNVLDIINHFGLESNIKKLKENDKLYLLIGRFTDVDLHPSRVDNHTMGNVFEELLRRFSEMSNETSGEHYTPRDVVKLLVSLVFSSEKERLSTPGKMISIYDPCCGTGGMLTIGKKWVHENISKEVEVRLFGQELNPQTYSICKSDFLITNERDGNIKLGSTLTSTLTKDEYCEDNKKFEYMITNPPYGVSWKSEQEQIKEECKRYGGRFSAGLPRVSDGSLLFLQHMISKMEIQGSRIGIVFNGSPLFTGDAGSGESEIRRWIIENDWLDCIVSLPTNLFFNTGIQTYLWIVTNKKEQRRRGKVQLINGGGFGASMKKNLGKKSKEITEKDSQEIVEVYAKFKEGKYSKIFDNKYFGYTKVTIEQPKVENGVVVRDKKGNPVPDSKLRGYERVPLSEDIEGYFSREVKLHLPGSWIDWNNNRVGYEINFRKHFYQYKPLRSSMDVARDLLELEKEYKNTLNKIIE